MDMHGLSTKYFHSITPLPLITAIIYLTLFKGLLSIIQVSLSFVHPSLDEHVLHYVSSENNSTLLNFIGLDIFIPPV